jgi:phosphatidylglycerophosphate synthase
MEDGKTDVHAPRGWREGERRPALAWLPNALTWARLLALPVLWALALLRMPEALAIGATAVAFTDLLDGWLARRLGVASRRGGALDSRADHLLSISMVLWLVMLRPEFFRDRWLPLTLWSLLGLGVLAVGWLRHGQPVNLHLWSGKAASFLGWAFGLLLLYRGAYAPPFFWFTISLTTLAALESLLVIATGRVSGRGGTLFTRRRAQAER